MTAKLTRDQKRRLAGLLIRAAADLLFPPEEPTTLPSDIPNHLAAQQLAEWLKDLPGDEWDTALPRPLREQHQAEEPIDAETLAELNAVFGVVCPGCDDPHSDGKCCRCDAAEHSQVDS